MKSKEELAGVMLAELRRQSEDPFGPFVEDQVPGVDAVMVEGIVDLEKLAAAVLKALVDDSAGEAEKSSTPLGRGVDETIEAQP